jgi:DNA recombination protein RmuC
LGKGRGRIFQSFSRIRSVFGLAQFELADCIKLDNVGLALGKMTETQERAQEALRQGVEQRLDAIRTENSAKLEEMRRTVDEKLQSTLEVRLGESFTRVVEQLERVHKGIGEMQSLAAGVGDLKKVLSNVRVRGAFGELQLGTLLEQFLSPEQFLKNAQVRENSPRVEFAIRLPGRDADGEVLLPVDAKFPHDDYERLLSAAEVGDAEAVAEASKALENRIRVCAKTIRDKYIIPPRTTDFAILFLPTESLYAEVLRRPGLFESIQLEYHITLTGPTTFIALLNALQMGFRSLAIEKRSSEVWKILGAVRTEFNKYNEVVDRLAKQLNTAAKSVETLGVRTRAMTRKLRDVEVLPEHVSQALLATEPEDEGDESSLVGEVRIEQQSTLTTTPREMGGASS